MREIKFRAWYKGVYSGEMIYDIQNEFEERINLGMDSFGNYLNNASFEVMQYTGVKDCNGKEVYEGDIVKYKAGTDKGIGYIKFEFSCFMIYWTNNKTFNDSFSSMFYTQCSSEIEVIGNIYENPELLK